MVFISRLQVQTDLPDAKRLGDWPKLFTFTLTNSRMVISTKVTFHGEQTVGEVFFQHQTTLQPNEIRKVGINITGGSWVGRENIITVQVNSQIGLNLPTLSTISARTDFTKQLTTDFTTKPWVVIYDISLTSPIPHSIREHQVISGSPGYTNDTTIQVDKQSRPWEIELAYDVLLKATIFDGATGEVLREAETLYSKGLRIPVTSAEIDFLRQNNQIRVLKQLARLS